MTTIAVIDFGMGNLRSVAQALEHVAPKASVRVTQNARDIVDAERVVFPGQGAIRDCMSELQRLDLIDVVRRAAVQKPFLGLCLGPQALLDYSEENGGIRALGVLPGRSQRFDNAAAPHCKIPHMGWNRVRQTSAHPLWRDIPQDSRFYFVHSYYLRPEDADIVLGATNYISDFASVIGRQNIFAAQFHPEKSARCGLQLLANFSRWQP